MSIASNEQTLSSQAITESGVRPELDSSKGSYGQILKSTALIGATSVLNIAVGIARSKAVALILGPSGVGLNGMYMSITGLTESIAGMGINSSGVRQIALAAGSDDAVRIGKTAAVLRRTSLVLGLLGALVLIALSRQISMITFGQTKQTLAVCILGVSVLFRLVSAGQGALLQGLRRISILARAGVLSSVCGGMLTIPLVYFFRDAGVAISVAAAAAAGLGISWWYSRRVAVDVPPITASEVRSEARALLHLGSALMVSGFVMTGCSYAIRSTIFRQLGAAPTGLYQAAWTLGGVYVGFILQAMGADFYPRLTAVSGDNVECNRLINEQAHVSLLLAGTGVIGTLTFAPLVIDVFYAASFESAVAVLRWICLGTALQVISWPMGFILLAKGEKRMLVWSELVWAIVHLCLAWLGLRKFGLQGAGMAFFASYAFHVVLSYAMANHVSKFHWSKANRNATLAYLIVIGTVFGGNYILPRLAATVLGVLAMIICGSYSVRTLGKLVPLEGIPRPIRRLLGFLGGAVTA